MHDQALPTMFAVCLFSLATAVAGCGAPADDVPMRPPPSDAVVYVAGADTESDVGVAKWGFATDAATGAVVFHGYDDHNAMIVELRQTLAAVDSQTARVTVAMTGTKARGSETIDFALKTSADGKGAVASMKVVENTFAGGGVAARVLAHLGTDAKSNAAPGSTLASGAGSLTQSHPLDDGLVGHCSETTVCTSELIDQKVAAAGAADKCGLVKPGTELAVTTTAGALGGAAVGGVGALPGALGGLLTGLVIAGVEELDCISARKEATKADQALNDCKKNAQASCGK
ncbi:MAG: hypothetical protein JWO86_9141 [Myxococcaceae bacterium]|nr:hypothetical protein [Myxococcaceae bacterium]